jgi:hypothetical protein
MARMSYFKIKQSGVNHRWNSEILRCYVRWTCITINARHDVRCKQLNGWHINIQHIFLINFHIKYFAFWQTVWEIWILQDSNIFWNFQKTKTDRGRTGLDLRCPGLELIRLGVRLGWAAPGVELRWRIWAVALQWCQIWFNKKMA